MNDILIYTERSTNRLTYTFDLLIKDLLGLNYELTHDKTRLASHTGAKFSYASHPVSDEIFFGSATLLFETNIDLQPIYFGDYNGLIGFYHTPENSVIPIDIFASAFFMVSRYEEYLPAKSDKYHRYRGGQSMNSQGGFLEKPMVNYYAIAIRKILSEKYPALVFKEQKFKHLATFDIDMAYSYLDKGWKRNIGGFGRSFLISDFQEMKERFLVLTGKKRDPFDTFDYIAEICKRNSAEALYFFQVGDESKYDKNIPHSSRRLRELIKKISEANEAGVHLSFKSHSSSGIVSEEIKRLEEITGEKIFRNRFHYLRFQLPGSYENLSKQGITEDYSMGYAPRAGFRAGICTPFNFFNLIRNEATNLKIYPLAFMDTTFNTYNKTSPEEATEKIIRMMNYAVEVKGIFISLWHNSSFTESKEWKGWKNVFETVLHEASQRTR